MKNKQLKSLLWIFRLQLRSSKRFFAWNIFNSLISGLGSVLTLYVGAKLISSVTAIAFNRGDSSTVYFWLAITLLLALIDTVVRTVNRLVEKRQQQHVEILVTKLLIDKMYELNQAQFDDEEFNTKLSRARDSVTSIWRLTSEISWLISTLVKFISSLSAIIVVSPVIGLVILIMAFPITFIRAKQNRESEKTLKKMEPFDRIGYRTRWYLVDPNFMPEIRVMNGYKHLLKYWVSNSRHAQNLWFNNDRRMIKVDITAELFDPVIEFGASLYFLKLLINGAIGLDRFIFLRSLLNQASSSAALLVSSFQRLHELSIDLENFSEVYNTRPTIPNGKVQVTAPLTIEFKDVSFAYPNTTDNVLEEVSFVLFPGSKLALVGENGAGKSTLIKLLLRQYLPKTGSILINGTDIKDVEQESYYHAISNLSQDFLMISHLTIKNNLLMGIERKVPDEEINKVLGLVGAEKFIAKLPNKLDQRLDPSFKDGTNLSGGQFQRIGVARALLRDGDVMILDEPTSAIDANAEYMIFNNIYKTHGNKTTLIVSHRFSTVRKADKIIVMENGRITEYGSHEELLANKGLYKEMFEAQAEGYK